MNRFMHTHQRLRDYIKVTLHSKMEDFVYNANFETPNKLIKYLKFFLAMIGVAIVAILDILVDAMSASIFLGTTIIALTAIFVFG